MTGPRPQRPTARTVLGELLLTAGALIALFVVWQLWWTDRVADREQGAIVARLDEQWGAAPRQVAELRTDEPPRIDAPPDGQVFGTLHVPAFDRVRVPLAEGVGLEEVLNVKGVGHYPATALPGEVGNMALAGHRNTYGRPFEDITRLQAGDAIVVETERTYYVYEVTEALVVDPGESSVIAPVPGDPAAEPTERLLTLTACHPMYSARERYIVHARFVGWTDRADGMPVVLADAEGDA